LRTTRDLYVRKSHVAIADSILHKSQKAIVAGTPGIGKSLFLYYMLFRLVQQERRVIFRYGSSCVYFDGKQSFFYIYRLPAETDVRFWGSSLWVLFGGPDLTLAKLSEY
jgi:hypothetical protein